MADTPRLFGLGPLETIVNVGWVSGNFVVVKFISSGNDTVVLTKGVDGPTVTVPYSFRRVTISDPGAVVGENFYAWHIVSQAYVTGSDGGTGRILIPLGVTGAGSIEQALTGINVNGSPQPDLFFHAADLAAATALASALNDVDDLLFAEASAHPADGGIQRHRYAAGSVIVTGEPPPVVTITESVFLVRVPSVKATGKKVISFTTTLKASLTARVYPLRQHKAFTTDHSGPSGFPDFPIRRIGDDLIVPQTLLWYIKQAPPGDDLPSALPAGTYTMSIKRDKYKNGVDDKIVQLYSEDFRYDVLSYRDPDDVLQDAPHAWKNKIGAPPKL